MPETTETICLDSVLCPRLVEAVEEALNTGKLELWRNLLSLPVADGFSAVLDQKTCERVFRTLPGRGFEDWILNIKSWRESVQDPRLALTIESSVLHDLWEDFSGKLTKSLRRARIEAGVPQHGGVLAFVGGLSKCVVIRYHFSGPVPTLTPVAVLDRPKSAFDIWAAIDQVDANARNILKNILASGHKLVEHRGVLVHVDRRIESRVFGPSIDTLVMAEILAREVYERTGGAESGDSRPPQTALEIGCGSGFLAAGLLRHVPSLSEVCCVDVEFEAIACTEKNLRITLDTPTAPRRADIRLLTGPFDAELLNRRFDLVVCNPPYIPYPPDWKQGGEPGLVDHLRAVGGIDLLRYVAGNAPNFLAPEGRLLLMTSSASADVPLEVLPKDYKVYRPLGEHGYEVFFDVEAVLNRPDWLAHLLESNKLVKRDDAYFHKLHPIWISQQ